jgi:lipopolysaccharide export system permease protein
LAADPVSLYARYLLAQIARPMVTTIVVALVALLAERTLRVVDLVVGWRGSLLVVVEMLGYLVPHYMGLAIPAAFFLGVLLTFARLSREGELAAIHASGVGLHQLLRPILVASIFLMIAVTLLASYLQPYGRYAYRAASQALTNATFATLLQGGVFTTVNDTTYMVEGISPDRTGLSRVFLFTRDDEGSSVTVTATSGTVERPSPLEPIVLRLKDGLQQIVPAAKPQGAAAGGERPAAVVLRFRDFETSFGGDMDAMEPRGEDERELTLPELWGAARGPPPEGIKPREVDAELNARLVRILSLPVLPFLGVPLALGRIRGQRSYGLPIGLAVLIGYHQLLGFGETLVDNGDGPAWLMLWVPLALFAALSVWLFLRAATRVPDPKGAPWLDRLVDRVAGPLRRAFGFEPRGRAA